MRRFLGWLLAGLAVVAALSVVAANVVLMTSVGPSMLSTSRRQITWRQGWAIVPWRVHLRDLRITQKGGASELGLTVDRVDAAVSIPALFAHRLDVASADLDGVTVSLADEPTATPAPPPARPSASPAPPIALVRRVEATTQTREWSLLLEAATATNVHEVAIGDVVYRGRARVTGSVFDPGAGPTRIEHAGADLDGGTLALEPRIAAENVRGHIVLDAQTVDVEEPARAVWTRTLDGGAELTADVVHGSARGTLRTSLRIAGGALAPRSTAEVHVPEASASRDGFSSADVVLGVDEQGGARVAALVRGLAWPPDGRAEIARADALRVELTSSRVRVADPFRGVMGAMHATGVRVDGARAPWAGRVLAGDHAFLGGRADLTVADGVASGAVHLSGEGVTLKVGGMRSSADVRVDASVRDWRFGSAELPFDLHAVGSAGDDASAPALALDLEDARARLDDGRALDATAHLHMAAAHAALDAVLGGQRLPPLLSALAASGALDATAHVHADAREIALRDIDASAGALTMRGELVERRDVPLAGTFLVEAGPLAAGVRREHGETTVVVEDAQRWFDRTTAASPP